jgi:small subunit ribosomal protein S8
MSFSDPVSNMLTILRNAANTQKETADIPASKLLEKMLSIMKNDGYIADVRLLKDNKQGTLKVYLKYNSNKKSAIMGIKRISKPGLRVYTTGDSLPRVLNGLGTAIISTSKGVITNREAKKLKVGGEVLCYIW